MQPMMLLLSVVFGILPLLGIVWTFMNGTITTVDGLFMSLILLTLSGLFFLERFLGMSRSRPDSRQAEGRNASEEMR